MSEGRWQEPKQSRGGSRCCASRRVAIFPTMAGAEAAATLPISDRLISRVIAQRLSPSAPIRELEVRAHQGDQISVRMRLSKPAILPPVQIRLAIEQQPQLPAAPILVVGIVSQGLASLAVNALKFVDVLPPGITLRRTAVRCRLADAPRPLRDGVGAGLPDGPENHDRRRPHRRPGMGGAAGAAVTGRRGRADLLEQVDVNRVQAVVQRLVERARLDTRQKRHGGGADHLDVCRGRIQPLEQPPLLARGSARRRRAPRSSTAALPTPAARAVRPWREPSRRAGCRTRPGSARS